MERISLIVGALGLAAACTQTATLPYIPEGGALTGAETRSLVDGGP